MKAEEPLNADKQVELPAVRSEEQQILLPPETARVRLRLEVPAGTCLDVEVEARNPAGDLLGSHAFTLGVSEPLPGLPGSLPAGQLPVRPVARPRIRVRNLLEELRHVSDARLATWLMGISVVVYLFVRLVGLPDFPIYFFTDEAVQTVLAADLLRDGFMSPTGEYLPTYFQNGSQYNLSTSVYLQVIPALFFGNSIWLTRGTAVLITLLAAFSVGLIMQMIFKSRFPWLAVLFLSATPVWFLHSRTAFETSLATSFFAVFLYFYLMYRDGHPQYLYGAVVMGALTFYSYNPARFVILVCALLLLIFDGFYHWQQRRVVVRGLGLALLLALPFARFYYNHPDASAWQMRLLGSYWIMDMPLVEKLDYFAEEFLHGLSPLYWYLPHDWDLPRHTMRDYGHLLRWALPLGILGIAIAVRNIRSFTYRTLLIAVLAAPAGAAVVRLGVTRALIMVIPMAILTALATESLLVWLARRKNLSLRWVGGGAFVVLAAINLYMLNDALSNGPLWFRNYGLTGMQFGAQQIFGEIKNYLASNPEAQLTLSPSWANGTDVVARFFFSDPLPFDLGSLEGYYNEVQELNDQMVFVLIPEEFGQIPKNHFSEIKIEKTVSYPDGRPGFYFTRLKYVDNIVEVIAKEKAERRKPEIHQVMMDGQEVAVSITQIDLGDVRHLFDGNDGSLVRTFAVNPMHLAVDFPFPRTMRSVILRIGGTATAIDLQVWPVGDEEPVRINTSYEEAPGPRDVQLDLPDELRVNRLQIEVGNTNDTPEGHVHLWEVKFQ